MIEIVVILIITAIIAAIQGDTSGLGSMGKWALYIGVGIGVALIVVEPILFVLVLVVGGVVLFAYWGNKQSNTNSTTDNTKQESANTSKELDNIKPNNISLKTDGSPIEQYIAQNNQKNVAKAKETNPTQANSRTNLENTHLKSASPFQQELSKNAKTPEQAHNEQLEREKTTILQQVQYDYECIKNQVRGEVETGQYTQQQSLRTITVFYLAYYLRRYMSYKRNPDVKPTPTFREMNPMRRMSYTFYASNKPIYDFYLREIKNLARRDNINIQVVLMDTFKRKSYGALPCTVIDIGVVPVSYSLYLKCTVSF